MPDGRVGCHFCFRTLDPLDNRDEFRTFVVCNRCNITYHALCWHQVEACLNCGSHQTEPTNVLPPTPLRVVPKTIAIPIQPSVIVSSEEPEHANQASILIFLTFLLVLILLISLAVPSPWSWLTASVGLILVLIGGSFGLYYNYRQWWQGGPALERIIVLLIADEKRMNSEQLQQSLADMGIPYESDQLNSTLNKAVQSGLLSKQFGKYHLTMPLLARVLRILEGEDARLALAKEVFKEHPFHAETQRFLKRAGFKVKPGDPYGLYWPKTESLWTDVAPLYARIVLSQALDIANLQTLVSDATCAYGEDVNKHVAIVAIDRPPRASDFHQVLALRAERGFTIVLLQRSVIVQALLMGREVEVLREQIDLYIGRTDLYDIRTPVTDVQSFFGRQTLLAGLQRQLTSGDSVVMYGVRKIGKSSLLRRLCEECDWPIAIIDLEGFIGGLQYIYEDALRSWQAVLLSTNPDLAESVWVDKHSSSDLAASVNIFRKTVDRLLMSLAVLPGKPGLLLFLDEIDILLEQPQYLEIARVLHSIAVNPYHGERFAILVAGLSPNLNSIDRIADSRNPFFDFFSEIPVGPLSQTDTQTMIISIGSQMGVSYTQKALSILVEVGGGHPFLTRQLCSQAVRGLERPATIDETEALQAISNYVRQPRNYLAESLWGVDSGGPPSTEATLLKLLADKQPQMEAELISVNLTPEEQRTRQLALIQLQDQSIVREYTDGWRLTIPLYRQWIRRYILNLNY